MRLSKSLRRLEKMLQIKNNTYLLEILYNLPIFLQESNNVALYYNFIVLWNYDNKKLFFFDFEVEKEEHQIKIKFKDNLETIKKYCK